MPPALWVVVDDGSSDETPAILDDYRSRRPYLRVLRRTDRGRRSVGPGVVEASYAGLGSFDLGEFPYLCKLDLDQELPARYFERLLGLMEANPRLGTTSGKPYFVDPRSGALVPEVGCGDEMSVGNDEVLSHLVLGSAAIAWGYFGSRLRGASRYEDPGFRRFLRRYQHACLLHGKREATRRADLVQAAVWSRAHAGELKESSK